MGLYIREGLEKNQGDVAGAARFFDPLPYPDYLDLDAAARLDG